MNKKIPLLALPLLGLAALLFGLLSQAKEAGSKGEGELLSVLVDRGELAVTINTVGSLDAAKSHMLSSRIRGNKGKIIYLIADGSWVEKDQVLVRLDASPFEEQLYSLEGKVAALAAAVQAAEQLVAWEKNQVEQNIGARNYDLKVARLDLKRLQKGDGPLQLAQYREEMGKAKAEYERYASFLTEIEKLAEEGFENPVEQVRAAENAKTYGEKYEAAQGRLSSYQDYVLPSMVEAARAKVENSLLQLAQSRKAAVFKVANAVADHNQAKARLATVQGSLKLATTELENSVLRAPFAGIAILSQAFREGQRRKPREGDTVLMQQPILYLPDISSLIVRTKVREVDLHKVAVGQGARVTIAAYPGLNFEATVQFIGALASSEDNGNRSGKYFQVILALKGQDRRLRPGMTARVLIQSEGKKDALLVPIQAVFRDPEGRPFAYRLKGSAADAEEVMLELGRGNELQVEVLAGLQQGDRLSLVPPQAQP